MVQQLLTLSRMDPETSTLKLDTIDLGRLAAEVAALRELEEETGIPASAVEVITQTDDWIPYDLPHYLVPKLWNGRFRGQKQKWFLMRFTGSDDLVNIQTAEPEFSAWQWLPPEKLLDLIVPFKRDTYEHVIKEFQKSVA
ncbi:MAG: RNA pyrophosphohydrolase [Rhodobacteraceae bacterium]|nr:MAG: RNA pyrophosphohydrolase [Paracoccaceae bacterium]